MLSGNLLLRIRRALSAALSVALLGLVGPALAHASDDEDEVGAKAKDEVRAYSDEGKRAAQWNERDSDADEESDANKDDEDDDEDATRVYRYKVERADSKGGYLGVQVQDITRSLRKARDLSTDEGALVNRVEEESPAGTAGIKRGDVIVQVGSESIEDSGDLVDAMRGIKPGSKVDVVVLRGGVRKTVKVEVAKRPRDVAMVAPGFRWHSNGMDEQQMRELRKQLRQIDPQVRKQLRELDPEEFRAMAPGPEFREQMEDLRREMDELKRELQDLREELDESRARERGRRSGS